MPADEPAINPAVEAELDAIARRLSERTAYPPTRRELVEVAALLDAIRPVSLADPVFASPATTFAAAHGAKG